VQRIANNLPEAFNHTTSSNKSWMFAHAREKEVKAKVVRHDAWPRNSCSCRSGDKAIVAFSFWPHIDKNNRFDPNSRHVALHDHIHIHVHGFHIYVYVCGHCSQDWPLRMNVEIMVECVWLESFDHMTFARICLGRLCASALVLD
jgi:hypothetical protein